MVKKRVTSRKPAAKAKKAKGRTAAPKKKADRSRLDLTPLQDHIRRRIKELQGGAKPKTRTSSTETIERLTAALETLEDVCHPTMDIPI